MNGSIISLIQENRKLFYRGVLKNTYKSQTDKENLATMQSKANGTNEVGIKEKSFRFLQEIFNE